MATELAKVTASDGDHGDQFGNSVSISRDGDPVILVASHANDDAGSNSGSAYVYRFDPDSLRWIQEQKLVAWDAAAGDFFGAAVAVSGDVALVGATNDDDACDNNPFCESGSAYLFRYDAKTSQWIQEQKLTASDGFSGDVFGRGAAIDGDLALVGALGNAHAGQGTGAAYLFRFDPDAQSWFEEKKLTASDAETWDRFGFGLAVRGDVAIVGAFTEDHDGLFDAGAAYVFRFDPRTSTWREEQKLTASDGGSFDHFGLAVSLSPQGDVALIGARDDDDAGSQSGSAYVFRFDPNRSEWIQEQKLAGSDLDEADGFGFAVALSDNVALIGALGHDDGGYGAGAAYVFHFDGSTWIEQAKLLASEPAEIDGFGFAVGISADGTAVIGAFQDDDACPRDPDCNSGSACIFGGLSDCNNNGELDLCEIAHGTAADKNNNGIPDECEPDGCTWDLDGNGSVGAADLLVLLVSWGPCKSCPADFDDNGSVGASDLLALLVNWGPCP